MDKTDHMEDIKIRFQHDYNEAIDNYNSGDCVLFFRNIRPAIETFCKLVIFDLVDTVLAEELLSGQKTLHCDYKNCTASFGSYNIVVFLTICISYANNCFTL